MKKDSARFWMGVSGVSILIISSTILAALLLAYHFIGWFWFLVLCCATLVIFPKISKEFTKRWVAAYKYGWDLLTAAIKGEDPERPPPRWMQ